MSGARHGREERRGIEAKDGRTRAVQRKSDASHNRASDSGLPPGLSIEEHVAILRDSGSEEERSAVVRQLQHLYGNTYVREVINRARSQRYREAAPLPVVTSQVGGLGPVPGVQRQFSPDAGDIVSFVMTGLAAIADEAQRHKALAAAEEKLPEIQAMLEGNQGSGVLVVIVMKQPDPRYYDPAVRSFLSRTFVGVFLRSGVSRPDAIAEWEAAGMLTDPNYKYECHYSWVPPMLTLR